ncbi:uncharacterized protein [Parasteatoda tepidariorum]|uniref:uncharacterized protein n=1 Tax=Parasteatoda tepidariorum TaxID=114398 RepID=UPI0039BC478E
MSSSFSLEVDESTLPCNVGFTVRVTSVCKDNNILLAKIMSIATDGAPAIVGRHHGFIALLKWEVPDILVVHSVIHRYLVGNSLRDSLHQSLQYVTSVVNKFHSNNLND